MHGRITKRELWQKKKNLNKKLSLFVPGTVKSAERVYTIHKKGMGMQAGTRSRHKKMVSCRVFEFDGTRINV